ncbi:molecular chaperone DnaJ [Pseudomonas sp. Irchel 3A7]|uniref:molecular chaperone DnaJ n=1 Tax=Pseudomonas sp. Irchel 3A7 TaxID=2008913 RepID=UPI000BA3BEAC|nr:molecular chaperone DnaJ [Pseudomonas sp. Irchel 3A7]
MKKYICPVCHGRGGPVEITCPDCCGTGHDPREDNPYGQCHRCYGEGTVDEDDCPRCGGLGEITEDDFDDDFDDDNDDDES